MVSAVSPSPVAIPIKRSFRAQMHQAREDAIIAAVNRLLAEKGFEAMTLDQVAIEVGIAKASLYKHFSSKEDLAAAAMVRVMGRAQAFLDKLQREAPGARPIDQLKAVARWTMEVQLAGEMPSLPSENSSLRTALTTNKAYVDGLMDVSDRLGGWITEAQTDGSLNRALPPIAVLYTLFARACDPVLGFLKGSGQYDNAQIIEMVLSTCFDGLQSR
ncbi:TetR/AcrR family transcriptional regulator [Hydrogenophaga sp.]|uniref:TetR/AcrR family transcriptional regulator n=1 Tax=Hydrogenophaga sp. TaxID=1904254 RepID=UPI00271D9BD6|nr:TetR/AcrR family transcriptional regulator [Hydrogenophaga sp.]MDO9435578.1 helix-turn-helix domain-containing protein [Hydrogenophaga sp.]